MVSPNPVRQGASVHYRAGDEDRRVELRIAALHGAVVKTLHLGAGPGQGQAALDLKGLAPGVYLAALLTDRGEGLALRATFKMAVVR